MIKAKDFELTKEQQSAANSLIRAFKKCKKANVYIHNCYGDLKLCDGNKIEKIDDTVDEFQCHELLSLLIPYSLDSWADDKHFIHFKK